MPTKTTFFQEPDEVCQSCKHIWEKWEMPYKTMKVLHDKNGHLVTTQMKKIPIVLCPYCDSDRPFIYNLSTKI